MARLSKIAIKQKIITTVQEQILMREYHRFQLLLSDVFISRVVLPFYVSYLISKTMNRFEARYQKVDVITQKAKPNMNTYYELGAGLDSVVRVK